MTYEIADLAKTTKKIVYSDRLKKASVKPRTHVLSESDKPEQVSETESDSADSDASAVVPITPAHALKATRNLRSENATVQTLPHLPDERPLQTDVPTKAIQLEAAAPATSNVAQTQDARRVSARSNKGKPVDRYSPTNFLFICLIMFLLACTFGNAAPVCQWINGQSE